MIKLYTTIILSLAGILFVTDVLAQVPQGFNFQAVARDAEGELITNSQLGVRVSVIQGSEDGTAVYTETQKPSTNAAGSFQLVIGEGTSEENFGAVDWSADNYYVKLEIDPDGGAEYEELGTTRLLSVPYALLAQDVVNEGTVVEGVELPLTLNGTSGNMSVTIGNFGVNDDYGYMELGDNSGNTMARMSVAHDSTGTRSQGQFRLNDSNGTNARLYPNNLYFSHPDLSNAMAWFGTLASKSGFYQILDYDAETNAYKGGILSGFWSGHPALLMENENEEMGVWLANEDGAGKLVLNAPDGENIQMGGKNWEDPNLPFLYFRGNVNDEGEQPDLLFMEAQKWEDGTELGVITLRGTDGSEFSISSHGISGESRSEIIARNESGEVVGAMNSFDPNNKQGFLHLYGETAPETDDLRAALEVNNNESGNSWGHFYLKGPAEDRHFVEASVSNDPGGSDTDGWSGRFSLSGTNSPNIEMRGKDWENSDLPQISLYGNKAHTDGWFYEHANLSVSKDGEQEWGAFSLKANEDVINVEIGAKHWENTVDGAGLPYIWLRGNTPDENLVNIEVVDDGENEFGSVNLRAVDGTELTIHAHGINGDTNINGSLHANGDVTYTGSSYQSSDRNLKENIQPLQSGLDAIMKLKPTTYNFKKNGVYKGLNLSTGTHFGLIAQEVEEVLPSLVKDNVHTVTETVEVSESGPSEPVEREVTKTMEYKTMNYTELIPVLIKGMQEQQELIEKLQKEIDELKNR